MACSRSLQIAAVWQDDRLVRRADLVAMGRDERQAAADPPRAPRDPRIRQRRVEADDDGVGLVARFLAAIDEAGLGEFLAQRGRAEDEEALHVRHFGSQVLDCAVRR